MKKRDDVLFAIHWGSCKSKLEPLLKSLQQNEQELQKQLIEQQAIFHYQSRELEAKIAALTNEINNLVQINKKYKTLRDNPTTETSRRRMYIAEKRSQKLLRQNDELEEKIAIFEKAKKHDEKLTFLRKANIAEMDRIVEDSPIPTTLIVRRGRGRPKGS